MKKRLLSFTLAFALAVATLFSLQTTALYASTPASGTCGLSAKYTFDSATHTLTISGNGSTKDYGVTGLNHVPWYDDRGTITTVIINGNITGIGTRTFYQMTALETVEINSPLATIGQYAFSESPALKTITLPSTVTTISTAAFKDCTGLTTVNFTEGLTTIESAAFKGCTSLQGVAFPNSLTTIGGVAVEFGAFQDCTSLATVTYGTGMTKTGKYTFYNCGVTTINFSETITTVDDYCFYGCKLKTLVLPEKINSINIRSFANNFSLTEATISNSECAFNGIIGEDPFNGSQQSLIIKGHSHSTAQTYAEEKGYTFQTIDPCAHETTTENITKEATCTEAGEKQIVCSNCGEIVKTVAIDALGHDFQTVETHVNADDGHTYEYQSCSRCDAENTNTTHDSWVEGHYTETTTATCEMPGTTKKTCNICGKTSTQLTAKLGHNVEEYTSETPATCTTDGSRTGTCTRCSQEVTVTLPATGHTEEITEERTENGHTYTTYQCSACGETRDTCTHNEWIEGLYTVSPVSTPTCTSNGSEEWTCTICSEVKTVTLDRTGHAYDEGVVTKEPTCTANGTKTFTCANCGNTYSLPISSLGHSYGEEVVEKAPTCTQMGTVSKTCTRCKTKSSSSVPALGHTVTGAEDYTVVAEPTCTETGIEAGTCTRCGTADCRVTTAALGHNYDTENATVITAPTCTQKGTATAPCTRCGETSEISLDATGHSYRYSSMATTTLGTTLSYTCTVCSNQTSMLQSALKTSFSLYWNAKTADVSTGYLYDVNYDGYITMRDYSIIMGH